MSGAMRVVTLVTPALGIIVAAGLSGCASSSRLDQSSTAVKVAANLPPPDSTTVPVDITPYRIGPGDELDVKVFGAPDLDRTGVVDAAGDFLLPLAGAVQAAGKTPEEFADAIEARLQGRYLKNPQVAVNFK